MQESEGTEEIIHSPSTLTCCKDSRPCPTVSQYQLDAPDNIFYLRPLSVTLTLELWTWVLCETHRLMMVNISTKY